MSWQLFFFPLFSNLPSQNQNKGNQQLLPCRKNLYDWYSCPTTRDRWANLYMRKCTICPWNGQKHVNSPIRPIIILFYCMTHYMSSRLKWKPPSENSIDFKLVLRFPPSPYNPQQPDWHAKPIFLLYTWCGESRYEQYDDMFVADEEWEEWVVIYFPAYINWSPLISAVLTCRLKKSGDQIDDRIVEVHWDADLSKWRMMRFRDDKPHANHKSVVESIIQSIADGVEKETVSPPSQNPGILHLIIFEKLLERCAPIRNAWKTRMNQPPSSIPSSAPPSHPIRSLPSHAHPPKQTLPGAGASVLKYGPIAQSPWSRVAGPTYISGMKRWWQWGWYLLMILFHGELVIGYL